MADRSPRRQDTAAANREEGYEGLKLSLEAARNKMVTMDASIAQIVEDNKGLRQDFRALMDFLKKDEMNKDKHHEMQEGGSSVHGPRSTVGNIQTILPTTPTRFGTLNEGALVEPIVSFMHTPIGSNVQVSSVSAPPSTMVANYNATLPFHQSKPPQYTQPPLIPIYPNPQIPFQNNMNLMVPSQQNLYTLPPYGPSRANPSSVNGQNTSSPTITSTTIPQTTPIMMTTPPLVYSGYQQT